MTEVHVSRISVSLLLLSALVVALYVYFSPENESFLSQKSSIGISKIENKHRNKRATVKSKTRNKHSLKKQTFKSSFGSKRTRGASGIEYDIDDPHDNVIHEEKELMGTRRPCSKSESCRKKRQAIKLVARPLERSINSYKSKNQIVENNNNNRVLPTKRKESYILFPIENRNVGRQFVTRNSKIKTGLFHTVSKGNVHGASLAKLERRTEDKRFPRDIVDGEDDVDGNDLLDELARYKRNNKGSVDIDHIVNRLTKSISHETDDANHGNDRRTPSANFASDSVPETILEEKRNDEEKEPISAYGQRKDIFRRLKRELNDIAYEEDIDDPNSGYGPWESWSYCSVTCGMGRSDRKRVCHNTHRCLSGDMEIRMCLPRDC